MNCFDAVLCPRAHASDSEAAPYLKRILLRFLTFRWRDLCAILTLTLISSCAESLDSRVLKLTTVDPSEADEKVQEQIAEYQDRVSANLSDATAIGELGVVYELHGFASEALDAYELASTMQPDEFRWPYYHAILLAARFDLTSALDQIDHALERNPDYGPAWIQKGKLLLDSSEYEEALASFERASKVSSDPYAHLGQAHAYMGLDDPDAALAAISKTQQLERHVNVQRLRAAALIQRGDREEGSNLLSGLATAAPIRWDDPIAQEKNKHAVDHLVVQLSQVTRLIRARSYSSALLLLAELKSDYPTNKHVLHLLSSVYELRGEPGQALATLVEGIELHPDFYVFRTAAASLLSAKGDQDGALRHLDRAIEVGPNLHWAYAQKAQLLMAQKQWLEASHLLDQAIGIKDDDADLYTYLGICMGFLDRWPEAANLYRVALSVDAQHVPAYINLARAETFLANETEAMKALENARRFGASEAMLASIELQRKQIKQIQIETAAQ